MTIGVVGRVYPGGRKGEHLVHELLGDREIMDGLQIIAPNDSWGHQLGNISRWMISTARSIFCWFLR